jgi:hypothetical protein
LQCDQSHALELDHLDDAEIPTAPTDRFSRSDVTMRFLSLNFAPAPLSAVKDAGMPTDASRNAAFIAQ